MILRAIRIRSFRCIEDTDLVPLEPDLTCLVGKNESGKTACLEAIHRLRPAAPGRRATFRELYDYPRRRRASDRTRIPTTRPVEGHFELEDDDLELVESVFGGSVLRSREVVFARSYDGEAHWRLDLDEAAAAKALGVGVGLSRAALRGVTTLPRLRSRLDGLDERTESQDRMRARLESYDLEAEVGAVLEERLPELLYFGDFSILPGRFSLPHVLRAEASSLDGGERTARALLSLAGIDSGALLEEEYEARRAALEAAAEQLTEEVFRYWSQDDDLRVEFDVDYRPSRSRKDGDPELRVDFDRERISLAEDREPPYLEVRVWNERHRMSLNFGERSAGFAWFFSFLAFFSSYRNRKSKVILLLDEPGLGLHASAQEDLLRFVREELATRSQVVMTTHSPFMIPLGRLEQVRTVEDEAGGGTRIRPVGPSVAAETLAPIQAALGFELARRLLVGHQTLIVGAPSDWLYLEIMSAHLVSMGRQGLDPSWTPVAAGAVRALPFMLALLGSAMTGVVVVDRTLARREEVARVVTRDAKRLVWLGGDEVVDLEDLFPRAFYLDLVSGAGVASVRPKDLGAGPVVEALEAALGGAYQRYPPAAFLQRRQEDLLERLSKATLDRFEDLFEQINRIARKEAAVSRG